MSRLFPARLTLSQQLLLLQMCIVVLVVTTVAGVSAVQTDQAFRRDESRRMLGTAESVATEGLVRDVTTTNKKRGAGGQETLEDAVKVRLERARVSAGADFAVLVKRGGKVLSTSIPGTDDAAGLRQNVQDGSTWSGTSTRYDRRTIEAQVPVFSAEPDEPSVLLGYLVVGRFYPSRLEVLGTAAPSVFLYLALAGAIGVAGSLLLARRVKRQTLGLEPAEIAALVEQREAMLHGVREGVLGVDLTGAVAFVNDEAMRLLELRDPVMGKRVEELGQQAEVAGVLAGRVNEQDVVVAVGGRLLVLNNQPIQVRERQTGWVTSMRDRTELLGVQQELADAQSGTDTLRAQVHEFRNRLHAISGMAELGQTDDLQSFVHTVMTDLDSRLGEVSQHVEDPAVAALVVAKASRADELGISFSLAEGAHLGQHAAQLSADLVTVVGNLVDNAFDAVTGASGSVVLDFEDDGERIEVEVRDSGTGIPADEVERAFQIGWTTKNGSDAIGHGFGLALTRMACQRHRGSIRVEHRGGAVLSAELFVDGVADG